MVLLHLVAHVAVEPDSVFIVLALFSFALCFGSNTMAGEANGEKNGAGTASETGALTGTMRVKAGLAQMLKGGVIMGESSLNVSQLAVVTACVLVGEGGRYANDPALLKTF